MFFPSESHLTIAKLNTTKCENRTFDLIIQRQLQLIRKYWNFRESDGMLQGVKVRHEFTLPSYLQQPIFSVFGSAVGSSALRDSS